MNKPQGRPSIPWRIDITNHPAEACKIWPGGLDGFLAGTSPDLPQLLGRPITDPLAVAADTAAALRPDGH